LGGPDSLGSLPGYSLAKYCRLNCNTKKAIPYIIVIYGNAKCIISNVSCSEFINYRPIAPKSEFVIRLTVDDLSKLYKALFNSVKFLRIYFGM